MVKLPEHLYKANTIADKKEYMNDTRYSKFKNTDLILRDELAIDRTLLANERTLLAYLRAGMALLITGVTIMHFAQAGWFLAVGIACLPAGIITGIIGLVRHQRMSRAIARGLKRSTGKPQD